MRITSAAFCDRQDLLDARDSPDVSSEELKKIEDRRILEVLERQKDLGLKIFTDGELRRSSFMGDFYDSVEGLDKDHTVARTWKSSAKAPAAALLPGIVSEKIKQTKRLTKDEVDFLRQHSPGDIKMTLPTANQFPAIAYRKGISDKGLPHLLRIPLGSRSNLRLGDPGARGRGCEVHSDRCTPVKLLHRSQVAPVCPGGDGRRSRRGSR